ncbi:MAG: OmpA family protein [Myxococcales bacterium]|nr:OmpA family protein [Myxococcales bacterium]
MHRTSLAFLVAFSAVAAAQTSDEWSTFPPAQPAPTQPAPAKPPPKAAPAKPPATAPAAPARATSAAPPKSSPSATTAAPQPAADGGVDEFAELPIVSQKERYLPGTEPHSPSTWGNAWNAKENSRVTSGQYGIGTVFVPSARLGPRGVVRVSFLGEYFNQTDFPVKGAQNIRSAITFAASFVPITWLEVFLAYGASANTNNKTSPNLLQALGDLTFGVKGSYQFFDGFHAAADLRLLTFAGVGNQGVDKFAVGFEPTLIATYDWRALSKSLPIVSTVSLGFTFDSTGGLVTNQTLNASEEFALGINEYHRINFGLAIEVPLPIATPFLEYYLAGPLGVPGGSLTGPDNRPVAVTDAMPQNLNLGAKITAIKDLTITSGVNIGLTRSVGLGVPATTPWNFYVAASFAIDPFQRGETKFIDTVRMKKVETIKPPPRMEGTITDKETGKPVAGAIVAIGTSPKVASDEQGAFTTHEVKAARVTLKVTRDGYKALEQALDLPADPTKPLPKLTLVLEPEVKKATFSITVTAAKKPVKAQVSLKGDGEGTGSAQVESGDAPTAAELPAGKYVINVIAEGFLAKTREVQISAGATMNVAFELEAAPKKPLVVFKGDKIEILQQVHFQTGKAVIMADSNSLLQQVVDSIVKNGVKRVRVEGHTDNRGKKEANQKLSEDRARAVADYLIAQGIEAARIESVGYGDSKPIAPNLTARGRELNRRVEFIVLEK